jgi:anti-anti-sigma factor
MSLAQISTAETKALSTTQSRNNKIQRLQLKHEEIGSGIASIHLSGRMDMLGVEKIDLRFTALTATQRRSVIVDLRDVELIVSVGLGLLIRNANTLKAQGKIMVLLNPHPRVEKVIRMAGLDALLPIEFSLTDALKRIKTNEF